jgi:hypothetical protein
MGAVSTRDFFESEGLGGDWLDVLESMGPPVRVIEGLAARGGDWGRCWNHVIQLDEALQDKPEIACAVLCHELAHFLLGDERHTPTLYGLAAGLARRADIEGQPIVGVFPTFTPQSREIERRVELADDVVEEVKKIVSEYRLCLFFNRCWPLLIAGPVAAFFLAWYV